MSKKSTNRPTSRHAAVRTLFSYIAEMNQWERAMIRMDFQSQTDLSRRGGKLLTKLAEIFERYCELGRNAGRIRDPNWGADTPDYDPQTERLVSTKVTARRAVIETQMTGKLDLRMRYDLALHDGRWMIRGERRCLQGRKWCLCEL